MVGAVAGELKSGKELLKAIGFWMFVAYVVSGLTYWCFTYWWVGVIFAVALVAVIVALYIRYKNKKAN